MKVSDWVYVEVEIELDITSATTPPCGPTGSLIRLHD